jgi:hypothetical protein
MKLAKARKLTIFDVTLPSALGVTFVITSKAGRDRLRKLVDERDSGLPKLKRWLSGYDTGISSLTIASVLGGAKFGRDRDVPHDSDDFGRCLRLVRLMEWRDVLVRVSAKYPAWAPIIERWDELAALHDAGKHEEIYDILSKYEDPDA